MLKISKFRHVAIIAQDLEVMKKFYTEILGFKCVKEIKISSDDFQCGIGVKNSSANGIVLQLPDTDVELEIFQIEPQRTPSDEISHTNSPGIRHISFQVENIQSCYDELTKLGIKFIEKPITVLDPKELAGFSFTYFTDPEGNIIELNELPK